MAPAIAEAIVYPHLEFPAPYSVAAIVTFIPGAHCLYSSV